MTRASVPGRAGGRRGGIAEVLRAHAAFALPLYVLIAVAMARLQTFNIPLSQFLLGVEELLRGGHIRSTFLPVGYPLLLAPVYAAVPVFGPKAEHFGVSLLNIVFGVGLFLCVRQILRSFTSDAKATWLALAVSLFPELLRSVSSVSDTMLAAFLVLACLLTLQQFGMRPDVRRAVVFGVTLGIAVLVRSNLLLFLLAGLLPLVRLGWRRRAVLLLSYVGAFAAVYVAVTTAVHGRPFFPQNGAYNLFAGMNPRTAEHSNNQIGYAELSILPALADLGYHPQLNWDRQSDQPGMDDSRDLRYIPVYRHAAIAFAKQHPGEALELTALKFYMLFRPFRLVGVSVWKDKWLLAILLSRLVPIAWLVAVLWDWRRGGPGPFTLATLLVALYVSVFVVTNSDPRFGTPVELLLLVDLLRIVLQRKTAGPAEAGYFTSAPRPAA